MRFLFILILISCAACKKNHFNKNGENNHDLYSKIEKYKELKSAKLIGEIFFIIEESPNDSLTRKYIGDAASEFYASDDYISFFKANDILIKFSIQAKDTLSLAKAYRYQAEYYQSTNRNDSAFQMLKGAEKLYNKLNDQYNLGKVIYKKAILQYRGSDLLGADLSMAQAYNLLRNSEDLQFVYQTLSMTGIIATALEDYEKALEYHKKALQFAKDNDLDRSLNQIESTLNNIGGVLQNLNKDEEAITNFKTALNSKDNLKDNQALYAMLLDNLAYSDLKLGKFKDVYSLLTESKKIRDSLKLASYSIISRNHLSEYYAKLNDTLKAMEYAREALNIAEKENSPTDKLLALKQISIVDKKRASSYSQDYIRINDSLKQAERKSRDKFAKLELETNQIAIEKDKLAEQNRNLLYFFVGTFMLGFLLFVIRSQRAKNRELLLKQAQQKANEDIYNLMINQQIEIEKSRLNEKKRIAQELHDGILGRLFGTRLNLDSLNKSNDEFSINKRNSYLVELKNIEQDIREISHDLSREKNEVINNFTSIVANLIEEQKQNHASSVSLYIDENIKWDLLPNSYKINSYRIIQESLQNANKYASANNIQIRIQIEDAFIKLTIEDDGVGFDFGQKRKGIGFQNMQSRTLELKGKFDVISKKGIGTRIIVFLPI